jgi:hypothetical protein
MGESVAEQSSRRNRLPAAGERLRCGACGNLTRFDVVTTRRTAAFWHFTLAGDPAVQDERDLGTVVEQLRCRWCGSDTQVQVVPAFGAQAAPADPGASR